MKRHRREYKAWKRKYNNANHAPPKNVKMLMMHADKKANNQAKELRAKGVEA